METEPAAQVILANLQGRGASLGQIRMWLVPQKPEHDNDYSINKGYFEMLIREALRDLVSKGYVKSSLPDGVEDGDAQVFTLTESGIQRVAELVRASTEQARFDY
jgi:hypothetical protein